MPKDSDKQRKDSPNLEPDQVDSSPEALAARGASILQTLASVSPVGILRTDVKRRCIFVNKKWCEMSGLTSDQSSGLGWLRAFHPDDRHRIFQEWEEAVRENRPYRSEYRFRRPDGTEIWIQGQAVAEHDEQGNLIGHIGTTTDITEQRGLQQQSLQAQKMEAVGQLAGGIAHEFNNLLTVITGYSKVLLESMSPNHPALRKMEAISRAAGQAAELTSQLLTFGNNQSREPEVFNLRSVLNGLNTMLRSIAGESITLEMRIADDLRNIEFDPGEIEHLVINLVTHASNAMPAGGTLTVEASNMVLDETQDESGSLKAGTYVVLVITDTGQGMSPEAMKHIFEPFSKHGGGDHGGGMRLAVAHEIVRQGGGRISAKSTADEGSTFSVYLPSVDKHVNATIVSANRGARTIDARILVVEDNDALREMVIEILESTGCQVVAAESPVVALQKLTVEVPDLIVTDVIMPVMNGPEMIDEMFKMREELRVLFMSGYTSDALEGRTSIRSQDILKKPFTPNELLTRVQKALND